MMMASTCSKRRPRVVIIGAGMAGLAAATTLTEANMFDIVVYEALERPGGRIHTSWQMGPRLIELGANWIHGEEGNPVYDLAKENGLLMGDESSREDSSSSSSSSESSDNNGTCINTRHLDGDLFVLEDGTFVPPSVVKKVYMMYSHLTIASRDASTHGDCLSVGEYFSKGIGKLIAEEGLSAEERHVYDLVAKWCLRTECTDNACQSVKDLGLAYYNFYIDIPGDFYCCLGKKGYQGVLDTFLEKLPKDVVKCNMQVDQVVWELDSLTETNLEKQLVVLQVKGHPDTVADHVIVTSSNGYLKEYHQRMFKPALPKDKQQAIETLNFGTVDKVFLKFEEPFWTGLSKGEFEGIQLLWEKDSWHDEPPVTMATDDIGERPGDLHNRIMRRFTGFDTVDGHDDVLCAWISGSEAELMEQLPDEDIAKMCTDILRKFLKRDIQEPTQVVVTRWHSNPYIRGSYTSTIPAHGTGEEFDVMSCPVWRKSLLADGNTTQYPVLLFAGEGCHKDNHSTVHAAMITGQQQAQRLIQFYQSGTTPHQG
ncbi:peroxisomal N(1)-acetyl-spermine/spermidine oxidase-like isoform X2 [Patiria miniata]|nr:peroxisomal N(1)-acetyl-spermine/spermidine oxidase-like isoform X2 [Patiria miniata]